MRQILILLFAAAALAVATRFAWQNRFERDPAHAPLSLAEIVRIQPSPLSSGVSWDSSCSQLLLTKGLDDAPVVQQLVLPGIKEVQSLHLSFTLASHELFPGDQPREDGRLTLLWHQPGRPGDIQVTYLTSSHGNSRAEFPSIVSSHAGSPAIPALRVEHLGLSGQLALSELELFVVQERAGWIWGRVALIAGWLTWAAGVAGAFSYPSARAWVAGIAWILLAAYVVLPGPWPNDRPLGQSFAVGPPTPGEPQPGSDAIQPEIINLVSQPLLSLEDMGEHEDQGSFILRVKVAFQKARPFLHFMLFFGPAWFLAMLVPWQRSLILMASLAILAESVQVLFGFEFNFDDVGDLLLDSIGTGAGLFIAHLPIFSRFRTHPSTSCPLSSAA